MYPVKRRNLKIVWRVLSTLYKTSNADRESVGSPQGGERIAAREADEIKIVADVILC